MDPGHQPHRDVLRASCSSSDHAQARANSICHRWAAAITRLDRQLLLRPRPGRNHAIDSRHYKQARRARFIRTAWNDYAKDGIHINAICPGYTVTRMTTRHPLVRRAM
ncbi:uncharacterized protein HMPREF1541_10331 [Cyphellophora europaea CBS 101466]|uniref:Uncharacterized protein n=1 Tax=Cyphellophora europaea (strain CBS 101466) TaxID=1220924 RepID=W2S7H6_CYPE1|nr:uncharacterized protein HMPREF1541_10331 [Cyphellophora europaea CBS 101466]ETN44661.1 hypothetical protein HMPREF1541_10331 [Cyphellophora europaea CBS 101466]